MIASSWAWVMTFFATSASRAAFSLAFALSSFIASVELVSGAVIAALSEGIGLAAKATPPTRPAPSTLALTIATVLERRIEAAFISLFSHDLPARCGLLHGLSHGSGWSCA